MRHLNIIVHGKVQGVNFRRCTREQAMVLGVNGFVENRNDRTVYIEAEGPEEQLQKFLDWCKRGPTIAEVTKVEKTEGEVKNYSSFEILRS